jgi:PPOX class probable F420-dependent enzyme
MADEHEVVGHLDIEAFDPDRRVVVWSERVALLDGNAQHFSPGLSGLTGAGLAGVNDATRSHAELVDRQASHVRNVIGALVGERPFRILVLGLRLSMLNEKEPHGPTVERRVPMYVPVVSDLEAFAKLVPLDHGLVVVSTARADGTIQSSVVNAGVLDHPLTGGPVVAFVAAGSSRRLTNLRQRPRATVVIRAGWQWAGVEGPVQLAGPDDPLEGIDGERLRVDLREIFTAAGGTHDDWDEYDRVMTEERRVAVLVEPERTYGGLTGSTTP